MLRISGFAQILAQREYRGKCREVAENVRLWVFLSVNSLRALSAKNST